MRLLCGQLEGSSTRAATARWRGPAASERVPIRPPPPHLSPYRSPYCMPVAPRHRRSSPRPHALAVARGPILRAAAQARLHARHAPPSRAPLRPRRALPSPHRRPPEDLCRLRAQPFEPFNPRAESPRLRVSRPPMQRPPARSAQHIFNATRSLRPPTGLRTHRMGVLACDATVWSCASTVPSASRASSACRSARRASHGESAAPAAPPSSAPAVRLRAAAAAVALGGARGLNGSKGGSGRRRPRTLASTQRCSHACSTSKCDSRRCRPRRRERAAARRAPGRARAGASGADLLHPALEAHLPRDAACPISTG